ncbi:hypothetical protein TNCV_4750541, partial [Trichonephila clavipes]
QFQFPMVVYNNYYENGDGNHLAMEIEDDYAGLMTQKEKEWLKRIQLLQLTSENPYVEDYYFTTQVARRCRKNLPKMLLKVVVVVMLLNSFFLKQLSMKVELLFPLNLKAL